MVSSVESGNVDTEAPWLEGLFTEHSERVYRAAYRVTGSAADAEDVLQTVFLRLLRQGYNAATVDDAANYLYRAGVNASLDMLRSRKAASQVPLEDAFPPGAEPSVPPVPVEQGQLRDKLRAAVARLHETAAAMFILRYYEGLENVEIARRFATTEGVVAVTLHRARARLQKDLAPWRTA